MILFETPLYAFKLIEDGKILKFEWTDETRNMEFLNFQEACMIYAGLAIEHNVSLLLIDTVRFHYQMPDDYLEWKNEWLNPRYEKVPVTKHAFVMKKEGFEQFANQEFQEATYVNRFFDATENAVQWLLN
ncbi:MAG: hypothetical protein AAFX87_03760 [Bacteroidota bacterium]